MSEDKDAQKARIDTYIAIVAKLNKLRTNPIRPIAVPWIIERLYSLEEEIIKMMREDMDNYYDPN